MIGLGTRLKMGLLAFGCKPFEITVEPYHEDSELEPGAQLCDNSWEHRCGCKNQAVICMTRTRAELKFEKDDHEHLCLECANKIKGKYRNSMT